MLHLRRILGLSFLLISCSPASYDPSTALGKKAILEQVDYLLTSSACDLAIALIDPLYESQYTDNEVRMSYASAHACKAQLNYFQMVNSIATSPSSYTGSALWQTLTQLFPSSSGDDRMEAGWLATDSLQSVLTIGAVVPTLYKINANTENVGSMQSNDRTQESNAFLMFVSMSIIGATQNRYGNPTAAGLKGNPLPWTTTALMSEFGCGYAGSIVNMLDGINESSSAISGDVGQTLADIYDTFGSLINNACDLGCQGLDVNGAAFDGGCAFTATDCDTCPLDIRNRVSCMASAKAKCASAGIVQFINGDPLGFGWQ